MINRDELMDVFGVEEVSQVRMIFCRIPWMKYYLGESDEDSVQENEGNNPLNIEFEGHEDILFYPGFIDDEECLAGVAFPGKSQNPFGYAEYKKLDLQNHYKNGVQDIMTNQCVDDVVVVWVAHQDKNLQEKTEPVIVGWWKYATLLNNYEEIAMGEGQENRMFNVMASSADAVLLDVEHRDFKIGEEVTKNTEFAHSNVWYADQPEDGAFREAVLAYMIKCENDDLNRLLDFYDEFLVDELE